MPHFICDACGGVSETPGICQTNDCEKNGDELKECNCDMPESHKKENTDNKE